MNSKKKSWDTINLEYPVRKFPTTGVTSNDIGHHWRDQPEVLKQSRPSENLQQFEYNHNYNIGRDLYKSQTNIDFGYKHPNTKRHNKHSSCIKNCYVYPSTRNLESRSLKSSSHGSTEMQYGYTVPEIPASLVTGKDQYKHPKTLPENSISEPSWRTELPPLDTTYNGFEKYLDPYLSTNRLHHQPFISDQPTKFKDIVTFYTLADIPWVRTPKPEPGEWWLPCSKPKHMYDRERFNVDLREIRVHNQLSWVPGSFKTESRANYVELPASLESRASDIEDDIRTYYRRKINELPTKIPVEDLTTVSRYKTEANHAGSGKAICAVINQYFEQNKRLK